MTETTSNKDIPELDTFREAYIECLLWSECDQTEEENLSLDAYADIFTDTWGFFECNRELFKGREAQAGHDFCLTRNGHGAGFWDGDWPEPAATKLTDASRPYGTQGLYRGDDGELYTHS